LQKCTVDYPRCCKNQPIFLNTYDCGEAENQTILVCEEHMKDFGFSQFIIKQEKVEDVS